MNRPSHVLERRPAPRTLRVACVDDDTLIREGLRRLLPGFEVVGAFASVEAFLTARLDVDVLLLDLHLHDPSDLPRRTDPGRTVALNGSAGVKAATAAGHRVLIYTNERRRLVLAGCLAAGARGIVHKSEPLDALLDAARRVSREQIVVTTALIGLAEVVERRGGLPNLSPRQLDVLRGRARGEAYKSIAARLSISSKTAEEYMSEVTKRFSAYLCDHSAADLERHLGVGEGDLLDGR